MNELQTARPAFIADGRLKRKRQIRPIESEQMQIICI
jgi:hypothetical protein